MEIDERYQDFQDEDEQQPTKHVAGLDHGSYLFDFFEYENNHDRIAVIFDDGKDLEIKLTYAEVNQAANTVEKQLIRRRVSGVVGVSMSQNHLYPSVQIGVMRSGHAVYNIAGDEDFVFTVNDGRRIMGMNYMIIDEETANNHNTWIKANTKEGHDLIALSYPHGSKTLRIVEFLSGCHKQGKQGLVGEETPTFEPYEYAYVMRTTGTTGRRKLVLVTHPSIVPNIRDFISSVWMVNSNDVIYGCSPPTFDPSVVDLFTALGSGGCILYSPKAIKLDGPRLGAVLMKHKVSIFQATPSFLRRFGRDLKAVGFFNPEQTRLQVLALGGEKCLTKGELKMLISSKMFTSMRALVNLYGVTEVSCWASYGTINLYEEGPITIDRNLTDTQVVIDVPRLGTAIFPGLGEILIKSRNRICSVLDQDGKWLEGTSKNHPMSQAEGTSKNHPMSKVEYNNLTSVFRTGDFSYCFTGKSRGQVLEVVGRVDSIVKRSGVKIPLVKIEECALKTGVIQTAHCAFKNEKIFLLVVPKLGKASLIGLGTHIRANFVSTTFLKDIHPQFYPDYIIAVHNIPINENGKIDVPLILKYIMLQNYAWNGKYVMTEETVIKTLHPLWNFITGNRETSIHEVLKENFYQMGGNSPQAVWFIENCFYQLNLFGSKLHNEFEGQMLRTLHGSTFHGLCVILAKAITQQPLTAKIALVSAETLETYKATRSFCARENGFENPCCDSVPAFEDLNQARSFQNLLFSLKYNSKCFQPQLTHNPRILCSVEYDLRLCVDAKPVVSVTGINTEIVFVGSHSGQIIAVDCNEIRNRFRQLGRVENHAGVLWMRGLPGRIATDIAINPEGSFIYAGCLDKKIYKLSAIDGSLVGCFKCSGSIWAKPSLSDTGDHLVVMDDCDFVYCIRSMDLQLLWKKEFVSGLNSSIFPVIESSNVFIITRQYGLTALSIEDGSIVWPWKVSNNCCTSPVVLENEDGTKVIICGAIDGVDCKDAKTGRTIWHYDEEGLYRKPEYRKPDLGPVFSPLVHNCPFLKKPEVIAINPEGRVIRIDNRGNKISEILMARPDCSPTVICIGRKLIQDGQENISRSCCLMSKARKYNNFVLYGLNEPFRETCLAPYRMDDENFSIVKKYKDSLIVGGRDNKLHVFFC